MHWALLGIFFLFGGSALIVYVKLMDRAMQYATHAISFLLLLLGAGVLFTAGFFVARLGLGMEEQRSIIVGIAVPAAYAAGRLSWVALGLPTPFSDYERRRDQDQRDYWN